MFRQHGRWKSQMASMRAYLHRSSDPVTSCVLVLPLLMLYNAGLTLTQWTALNGADFLTTSIVQHLGLNGFLYFQAAIALTFIGAIVFLRHKRDFTLNDYIPLLAESSVYAFAMGTLILFVLNRADLLNLGWMEGGEFARNLTISAGAGVHEEMVFRLLLIPSLILMLNRWARMPMRGAAVSAVLISSLIFSLAHYAGPEAFSLFTFAYRTLAGIWFALLFLFRGFAVAVYTHCLYDVYVLSMQ